MAPVSNSKFAACLAVLLALAWLWAHPSSAAAMTRTPRATFLDPAPHLKGIQGGDVAHYRLRIRDDGGAALHVLDVVPSCGCTTVSFDRVIAPGHIGVIRADLQTQAYWESAIRQIDVLTDDPHAPRTTIILAAEIVPAVTVSPSAIVTVHYDNQQPIERTFTLHVEGPSHLTLDPNPSVSGPVTAHLSAGADSRTWTVTVVLDPPADGANVDGRVLVAAVGRPLPPIPLVIVALGNGIERSPSDLFIPDIDRAHLPVRRDIMIYSLKGWFHVLRVECDPEVSATWSRINSACCMWKIDLIYRGGWPPGKHDGSIKIFTDAQSPGGGVVTIPLHATVLP
ncbi:MAG TPA: DUF1573 domain-containing protein [Armatimonadota bacterium]|nr:DUF1573 domain-containing protein [Armatimonadota bacterium]